MIILLLTEVGRKDMSENTQKGIGPLGICPFCRHGMQRGYIDSCAPGFAYWMPEEQAVSGILRVKGIEKAGGVVIYKALPKRIRNRSYHCRNCGMIIVDMNYYKDDR